MMKHFFIICLLALISSTVLSQVDYNKQYFNAKALFREGKYNLAMESFKRIIPYDQNNQFSEYSSFYYAISAYRLGYKAVAKDMLNQIKSLHSKWDKMDEVNFWLATIHFENRDYFQALKVLQAIQDKKLEKDIEALKTKHLSGITDSETLKMMLEEYPKDGVIAKFLAHALSKNISNPEDKKQLEALVEKFKLKRTDFIIEAPKTFYKDRYTVAVLLPSPTRKGNQIFLELYTGLKLAVDTLSKQNISISLRAYDTEKNPEKIKRLLATEELKNTDLIIGPFFVEENKVVQDFSMLNKINVINPVSSNTEILGTNPYAFLFQPSSETLGKKSAEYLASRVKRKNCMVFYGTNKKDSVMMANFVQTAAEKGLKVVSVQKINSKDAGKILTLLSTPTEFDEFKYPSQFTLKKDSIGSIYVASDEALIYSKVISGVETRGDSIKVVGAEKWLDDNVIDLEKYESLGIVLASPNYVDDSKKQYQIFLDKIIRDCGRTPSKIDRIGYELMLFFGNQLKTNGVYFQEGLNKADILPGYLGEGFNFKNSRDNQRVPFISMKHGKFGLVEKR
jgi:tetratricopeptide (TPR) repeat protein